MASTRCQNNGTKGNFEFWILDIIYIFLTLTSKSMRWHYLRSLQTNHSTLTSNIYMKLLPHPFLFSLLSQYQHRGRRYFSIDSSVSSLASDSSNHNQNLGSTTVAVVGSGAVGGYYGARLHEAGYNVKFFMRGEHYETCCKKGLYVHSVEGDIQISRDELQVFVSTDEIGTVDWILLSIKSSSLDVVPQLLEPLLGEDTRVIAIMNGLVDDDLVDMLEKYPHSAIYGGMAFICSTRIEAGIIDHSFYVRFIFPCVHVFVFLFKPFFSVREV